MNLGRPFPLLALFALAVPMLAMPAQAHVLTGYDHWHMTDAEAGNGWSIMVQVPADTAFSGNSAAFRIPAGACHFWLADQPALHEVPFSSDDWRGDAHVTRAGNNPQTYPVRIGSASGPGAAFTPGVHGDYVFGQAAQTAPFVTTNTGGVFSVPQGEFLVVEICNPFGSAVTIKQQTWIASPEGSTAYPSPELATFALMGVGVVAMVGLGAARRKSD